MTQITDGAAIDRVLDACGWSATRRSIDYSGGDILSYPVCSTYAAGGDGEDAVTGWPYSANYTDIPAIEAIRNIEMSAGGRFYIDHAGNATYESRFARSGKDIAYTFVCTGDDKGEADIVYEYDDREIYNDIRSQIPVTETITIPGYEAEYYTDYVWGNIRGPRNINGDCVWFTGDNNSESSWGLGKLPISLGTLEISPAGYFQGSASVTPDPLSGDNEITVTVTLTKSGYNQGNPYTGVCVYACWYSLLKTPSVPETSETRVNLMTVRSINEASWGKYGRRVMNLTWPLGQTQNQMQGLVDAYCARYAEPVPRVTLTVIGKTDNLIVKMLNLKISDRITVVNTVLGLSADYFINNIVYEHDVQQLPRAIYTLEEIRGTETWIPWILGVSELGVETKLG